jgi:class 3 adenylate cyclase
VSFSSGLEPSAAIRLLRLYRDWLSAPIERAGGLICGEDAETLTAAFGLAADAAAAAPRAGDVIKLLFRLMDDERDVRARAMREVETAPELSIRAAASLGGATLGAIDTSGAGGVYAVGGAAERAEKLRRLCDQYGVRMLADEAVAAALGTAKPLRRLDRVRLAAGEEPFRLHEPLFATAAAGVSHSTVADAPSWLERFHQGLADFEARRWRRAKEHFDAVLELRPDDGPAALFSKRSAEYSATPPPRSWDGVFGLGGR